MSESLDEIVAEALRRLAKLEAPKCVWFQAGPEPGGTWWATFYRMRRKGEKGIAYGVTGAPKLMEAARLAAAKIG